MKSSLSPPLCIFFKGFIIFLGHVQQFPSIRSYIHVVLVLFDESIRQILETMDVSLIKGQVPFGRGTFQTVLKIVDHKFVIVHVSCHLSTVHDEMTFGTNSSFILFKVRCLEFCGDHQSRHKENFSGSNTKDLITFHCYQPFSIVSTFSLSFSFLSSPSSDILDIPYTCC